MSRNEPPKNCCKVLKAHLKRHVRREQNGGSTLALSFAKEMKTKFKMSMIG